MFEMGPYSSFVLEARTEALRALQGVFYSSYLDLVGNILANIGIATPFFVWYNYIKRLSIHSQNPFDLYPLLRSVLT